MAPILDPLPIPEKEEMAFVGAERVRIKECEIIVWVSLSVKGILNLAPGTPCFPAILDTGHTHNFSIQEQHLVRLGWYPPRSPPHPGGIYDKPASACRCMPSTSGCTRMFPINANCCRTRRRNCWNCHAASRSTRPLKTTSHVCPFSAYVPCSRTKSSSASMARISALIYGRKTGARGCFVGCHELRPTPQNGACHARVPCTMDEIRSHSRRSASERGSACRVRL